MTIVLIVIGCIVGGIAGEIPGAILGAAMGFLLGDRLAFSRRLDALETRIAQLANRLSSNRSAEAHPPEMRSGAAQSSAAPHESIREPPVPLRDAVFAGEQTEVETQSDELHDAPRRPEQVGTWRPQPRQSIDEIAAVRWVRTYFTTGNLVVKIGALILIFGVGFLLKYAAEHARVPLELRLAGVCAGAIVLLGFGWRLRARQYGYGLILQGVAIGVLYLTVFAGLRLYALVPAGVAFVILVVLAVFSTILAVLQNSLALAMFAATGGFLAPILTSTGQGSHVMLFSYYAILNLGILGISWFKSWRLLNLLGFAFTFGIGTAWGVLRYRPEHLASTEPFLILFFLFYVAIAVVFALRQAPRFTHYVDGSLIFGTPVVAFGLQTALVHDIPYALSFSAVLVSAFYLLLATALYSRHRDSLRLLVEAFLALGVAFATLAVPLALDGRWTAATWALEGAALLWVGLRQSRLLARAAGVLLQFGAGIAFVLNAQIPAHPLPILHSGVVGAVLIAAAALLSSRMLYVSRARLREYEAPATYLLFAWGVLWWAFAGLNEISRIAADPAFSGARTYALSASLLFLTITAWFSAHAARRLAWPVASVPGFMLLAVMAFYALASADRLDHPLAAGGWLAWPIAFAAWYSILRRHEETLPGALRAAAHAVALWLALLLLSGECAWWLQRLIGAQGVWTLIAWAVMPAFALVVLPTLARSGRWPVASHRDAYLGVAGLGIALYLALWSLVANLASRGDPAPLPYVPFVNPLDLAQMFALLGIGGLLLWHWRTPQDSGIGPRQWPAVLGALALIGFVWLNAVLLRTLHHWGGVPFDVDEMARSTLVQSALSIFWTVLALSAMLWSARKGLRIVWFAGAALMAVVVLKLFVIDLSNVGTIARIVSFLAVGGLMLVIGYFSPVPPTRQARA